MQNYPKALENSYIIVYNDCVRQKHTRIFFAVFKYGNCAYKDKI